MSPNTDLRRGPITARHRHGHDYVIVPLMDGKVKLETKDGTSFAEMKRGAPYSVLKALSMM